MQVPADLLEASALSEQVADDVCESDVDLDAAPMKAGTAGRRSAVRFYGAVTLSGSRIATQFP